MRPNPCFVLALTFGLACGEATTKPADLADPDAAPPAPPQLADAAPADASRAPTDGDADATDEIERCGALEVSRAALIERTRSELRTFFELPEEFADGELTFRELTTRTESCPSFDQSQLTVSMKAPDSVFPAELRAENPTAERRVLMTWGLNGNPYIFFGEAPAAAPLERSADRFPIAACSALPTSTSEARANELVAAVTEGFTRVPVRYLAEIHVLCLGPKPEDPEAERLTGANRAYYAEVLGIAARIRDHGDELGLLEWSRVNFNIDQIGEPAVPVLRERFDPECLRTSSAAYARSFVTLPSLPEPFGPGLRANPSPDCE